MDNANSGVLGFFFSLWKGLQHVPASLMVIRGIWWQMMPSKAIMVILIPGATSNCPKTADLIQCNSLKNILDMYGMCFNFDSNLSNNIQS